MSSTRKVAASHLVAAVFDSLEIDPALARKKVKTSQVARGRAIAAWIWTECLGWPLVAVADGLGVRPNTVSSMLSRLRREGLSQDEEALTAEIMESLTENENSNEGETSDPNTTADPKIFLLKRQRETNIR